MTTPISPAADAATHSIAAARLVTWGCRLAWLAATVAAHGLFRPALAWFAWGPALAMCTQAWVQRVALRDPWDRDHAATAGHGAWTTTTLTLTHGLLWGLPVLAAALGHVAGRLEAYAWIASLLALFLSAAVALSPGTFHLLVGSLFGSLLVGWALESTPSEHLALPVAVAAAWALCSLVHARTVASGMQAGALARRRHEDAEALRERNRLLAESNASRIRVLSTASHEIRQPVHALGMLVERLRVEPLAAQVRGQVDEIASVVHTLAHGLELLLDISRLDAGTVRVNLSSFPLRDLLERVCGDNEPLARGKGLRLRCDTATPARVRTDPMLLHGIVTNFVSNAIRYTEHGSVTISIEARQPDEVWVHVSDTGRGIPDDMHEAIFHEYVRVDRENQSVQGFGLGLAIVRRTALLLGLRIEMKSRLGQGSRFSIGVPVSTEPAKPEELAGLGTAPAASVSRNLIGLRGLLLDNDPVVLRGMEGMARSWGCRPVVSTSVDDLRRKLEHVAEDEFDFIIADFHLGADCPTGLDAIAMVRQRASRFIAATLLTGDVNVRPPFPGLPDVHVLHKPVMPARLRAAIDEMASESRKARGSDKAAVR